MYGMLERIVVGSAAFKGLTRWQYSPAYRTARMAGGSELDASLAAIVAGEPAFEFETVDVDAALRLLWNTTGTVRMIPHLPVASGTPLSAYLQDAGDGITRGGAGLNTILRSTKGVIVPTRLAGAGDMALLSCAFYPCFDGTNLPVQKLVDQNLAAGTSGAAALSRRSYIQNGASTLYRCDAWTVDFGISVDRPLSRGLYAPSWVVRRFAPSASWVTTDLVGALAACGFATAACGSGGLKLILALYSADGVGVESTGNIALTLRAGSRFVPQKLTLPNNGIATLGYAARGSGAAQMETTADAPLTLSTSIAVPAESQVAVTFGTGPAYNGATRYHVRQAELDFGMQLRGDGPERGPANLPWPTHDIVEARAPQAALALDDLDDYTDIAETAAIDGAGFGVYARALTAEGQPLADAETEHLLVMLPAGRLVHEGLMAEHNKLAQPSLRAEGTNAEGTMLSVSTGQAIAALS